MPNLELPYDNARPPSAPCRQTLGYRPANAFDCRLEKLAAGNKSTLMSTLMAGFVVYLNRWSGATQIVLGCPLQAKWPRAMAAWWATASTSSLCIFELTGSETFSQVIALCQTAMLEALIINTSPTAFPICNTWIPPATPANRPWYPSFLTSTNRAHRAEAYQGLSCAFGSNPRLFENFDLNINITLASDHAEMKPLTTSASGGCRQCSGACASMWPSMKR